MAFKMFNGKASCDSCYTLQLLSVTPKSPKIIAGHCDDCAWIVVTLTAGQDCLMLHLPPGPGPNCGQAGHLRANCPILPRQGKVSLPHVPPPQENLLPSEPGSQSPGISVPNSMENTGAWDDCLGNGLVSVIYSWYLGHLDYTSCSNLSFSHL